ncbi:MAG: tRNA epoxyqueuosine(34) reductase QueG [Polyangiales bacterium]
MTPAELTDALRAESSAAGFAKFGVAEATALEPEGEQLDAWLAAGHQGQMAWMDRTADVRKDPRHANMLSGARSVIVLAAPYPRHDPDAGPGPARVAKYALGRDYHNVLTKKARRLHRVLHDAGHVTRIAVDSKPVFERAWAERAGIGFVGKNCCLIVPGLGSHVFLVCLVTTAKLSPDTPTARKCGSCTLCLDACPTRAFTGPRRLDATKCVSYLTIEHRGPIPEAHREGLGPWLFGCDVCQDVCPYNQTTASSTPPLEAFSPGARWEGLAAEDFLRMDETSFQQWARGSPLKRATREGLARNSALVLGNRGQRTHLHVLENAARDHESEVVREAAHWATTTLRARLARSE